MDALASALNCELDRRAIQREIDRRAYATTIANVEAWARRTLVLNVKTQARRYDRAIHLSKATGVYVEYCHDMPRPEAIRRLGEALARAREQFRLGREEGGVIFNARESSARLILIRAALICERLARRRDYVQAKAADARADRVCADLEARLHNLVRRQFPGSHSTLRRETA